MLVEQAQHGTLSVHTSSLVAHFRTWHDSQSHDSHSSSNAVTHGKISRKKNTPIPGLLHGERGNYFGQGAHVDAQRQRAIASAKMLSFKSES